jgi:hypothetical protein
MKVLVYGMPRTCTTVCCQMLSQSLKIANLLEKFGEIRQHQSRQAACDFLATQDQCVAKILTIDCIKENSFSYNPIDWSQADRVVITSRKNYTNQICSDYFAREMGKHARFIQTQAELAEWRQLMKTTTITVPMEHINRGNLLAHLQIFRDGCDHIRELCANSVHEVTYEDFQLPLTDLVAELSKKLWFDLDPQIMDHINTYNMIRYNPDYTRQVLNYQELDAVVQRALA